MLHEIFNEVFDFTLRNVFYFYWLPLAFCIVGWTLISVQEYRYDVRERQKSIEDPMYSYNPELKLGRIIGRYIAAGIPLVNLGVAIFKFLPRLAGDVIETAEAWLDIPLVPKPKK